jgi:chromosome segregation ATPase
LDQTVYKDSISVLRGLDRDWRAHVERERERVESYSRTIKVLRESLEEIRTATGLGVLRDIVTAVVKSNEQERMIVEQLGKSASEAEFLQKVLGSLRAQRQASREGQRAALEQQTAKLNTLKQELETLRDMLTAQTTRRQKLTRDMQSLFPLLQHLLSLFQTHNIPPHYPYPQEPLSFSESELLTRVNALEAGLSYLLTYLSAGGLPVLNGSDLSPKAFNSIITIVPPHGNSEWRLSEDSEEQPLTESEFRSRAARRVPIPKLW